MMAVLGATISHYRILDRLGAGAMGEVYRAEDLRLRRVVALKTIAVDEADPSARRLLAEARAASALNHPGIAVVYEVDHAELDGRPVAFIAMEYVSGATLAQLASDAPLDLDTILDYGVQAAEAIAEANDRGIVHRDVKPSNLMVTETGRLKVLDFGVATQLAPPALAADASTRTADLLGSDEKFAGTLAYMAPEQATGRAVDARADMFSLGAVLYELVCGIRPFRGDHPAQVLEALLSDEPPHFITKRTDPRLPEVERVVRRMLAKDPARRFATLREAAQALAAVRQGEPAPRLPESAPNAIAVADFSNITGNPEDDWLGTGIAETLTADLSRLEAISVIPRGRVHEVLRTLAPMGGEEALQLRAGRELGARWVLSGAFQRAGTSARVTATLLEVPTGQIVRTAKVDGALSDIFALQDQLVRELGGGLRTALASHEEHSADTQVIAAYEAFSKGVRNLRAESYESLDRAIMLFERAVRLDPSYARAYVELGNAYGSKADYLSLPELRERALASLRKSLELQPESAVAWRYLGGVLVSMGKIDEGEAAIRHALSIEPDNAGALGAMARTLFIGRGRFQDAADYYDRALARNPHGGWYALQLAHCAALLREFERGEAAAERAIALQQAFFSGQEGLLIVGGHMRQGHLFALQGRYDQAVDAFERELSFLGRVDHALRSRIVVELHMRLGESQLRLGREAQGNTSLDLALEGFERRVQLGAEEPFTRYYAACVYALRNDPEPALALLQRCATELRAYTVNRARLEPAFERLQTDSRFQRLVQAPG
jgi:serine/threonine protein kinase/tetratricopeptide (TPR) repeat protein